MAEHESFLPSFTSTDPFGDSTPSPEGESASKLYNKMMMRIRSGRKLRGSWERDFDVVKAENYFIGKQHEFGDSQLVLNHFFALLKAQQPNLFFRNPRFLVRVRPGQKAPATDRRRTFGEAVLTAIGKQDNHLERAVRLGLTQAFFRIGVLKVTYDPQLKDNPRAGEQLPVDPYAQQGQQQQQAPLASEPAQIVSDDVYRFEWVNAKNMILPDQGPDMNRWTWLAEEVVVTLDEAKNDHRFNKTLRNHLKSNESKRYRESTDDEGALGSFTEGVEDEPEPLFRYFELYDILEQKQYIFAEGQDQQEFLVNDDTPEGIEDHPYAILPGFTPILAPLPSPWPFPHTQPWIDPQREYNIRRQQIIEGAKRSARKIGFDAGTFINASEATKMLQSPRDMEAVELTNTQKPPVVLEASSIPQGVFADVNMLLQDLRIIPGQTGPRAQGGAEKSTATEARFVDRAADVRDADLQGQVNLWLATAGQKMFQLVQQTMTTSIWVSVKGLGDTQLREFFQQVYGLDPQLLSAMPNLRESLQQQLGEDKPWQVSRGELEFSADVEVLPGSARPRSLEVERQEWLEFLTVFGQFPQLGLSRELLNETASKYEFISDRMVDELFALAQKMLEAQQKTAGREQGGGGSNGNQGDQTMDQVAQLIQAGSAASRDIAQ